MHAEQLPSVFPASDKEPSVPLRRVKAPPRKRNRAKAKPEEKPEEKPSDSPELPVETHSSPEERSDRQTRSRQRRPATERTLNVDTVAQKQSKPEKKQWAVPAPSKSVNVKKRSSASSGDEVTGRKKPGKEVHSRISKRVLKPPPNYVSPSSDSSMLSEESEKEVEKRPKQTKHKQSKRNKSSPPTKPVPKLTQSSKKPKAKKGNAPIPQNPDEDEWTEAELLRLKEYVS